MFSLEKNSGSTSARLNSLGATIYSKGLLFKSIREMAHENIRNPPRATNGETATSATDYTLSARRQSLTAQIHRFGGRQYGFLAGSWNIFHNFHVFLPTTDDVLRNTLGWFVLVAWVVVSSTLDRRDSRDQQLLGNKQIPRRLDVDMGVGRRIGGKNRSPAHSVPTFKARSLKVLRAGAPSKTRPAAPASSRIQAN